MSSKSSSSSGQRSEADLKQERLAQALRENLKRRKSQKRGRSDSMKDNQNQVKDGGNLSGPHDQ